MKLNKVGKCLAAWTLSLSMVLGSGAFIVPAADLPGDEAAASAEAALFSSGDTAFVSDAEPTTEPSVTPGQTAEPTPDASPTVSPQAESSPSPSGGATPTETPTETPTVTPTVEPTLTPTPAPEIKVGVVDYYGVQGYDNNAKEKDIPIGEKGEDFLIFEGSTITVSLGGDTKDYEIGWKVENLDKDGKPVVGDGEDAYISVEEVLDNKLAIEITGKGISGENIAKVTVKAVKAGTEEELASAEKVIRIHVQKPDYPDSKNLEQFMTQFDKSHTALKVKDEVNIGDTVRFGFRDANNPMGVPVAAKIKEVKSSNPDVIKVPESVNGWYKIEAVAYGDSTITISFSVDDPYKTSSLPGTISIPFTVVTDTYNLQIKYPNSSTNELHPGETMVLTTVMQHWWNRVDEQDSDYEEISNYKLEITDSTAVQSNWPVVVTTEGTKINVVAKDVSEDKAVTIHVKAVALDNEDGPTGEECEAQFDIQVKVDGFYVISITDQEVNAVESMNPGDTVTISPSLILRGDEDKPVSNYYFKLYWDTNVLEIKDADGGKILSNTIVSQGTYTIKKLINAGCQLTIAAFTGADPDEPTEPLADLTLTTNQQDYGTDFDLTGERWDGRTTTIYSNEENRTLTLKTDNLEGLNYTVDWTVGKAKAPETGFEIEKPPFDKEKGYYSTNKNSIVLHGDVLSKISKADSFLGVQAKIKVNGIDVGVSPWVWVQMKDPVYDYAWPSTTPNGHNVLLNGTFYIDKMLDVFVVDASHPKGEKTQTTILGVDIVNEWEYKDGEEVASSGVVTVSSDSTRWAIQSTGKNGKVQLDFELASVKPGEEKTKFSKEHPIPESDGGGLEYFDLYVGNETWVLEPIYADGNLLLREHKLTVNTKLTHSWLDKDGNNQSEIVNNYTLGKIEETHNNLTITTEGTSVTFSLNKVESSKDEYPSDEIIKNVTALDADGKFVASTEIKIEVGNYAIKPDKLLTQEKRVYNSEVENDVDLSKLGLSIVKPGSGEEISGELRYTCTFNPPNSWNQKSKTEPVIIHRLTSEASTVHVSAEQYNATTGKWESIAKISYEFKEVCPKSQGHKWTMRNEDPTCVKPGAIIKRCTACGVEVRRDLDALGHDWVTYDSTPSTCEQGGTAYQRCSRCGATQTVPIAPGQHSPATRYNPAPTCTTPGVLETYCTVCLKTLNSATVPATGHTPYVEVTVPATCGTSGTSVTKCSVCGATLSTNTIPATGNHTWGAWKTVTPATDTTGEVQERECSVCHQTERRTVNAPSVTPSPTPTPDPGQPLPETELVGVKEVAPGTMELTWTPVSGAEGYRVYRKLVNGSTWERIGTVEAGTETFTDNTAAPGQYYVYTVRAYRGNELGGYDKGGVSNIVIPEVVDMKDATATTSGNIRLSWTTTEGADGYIVYRKAAGTGWTRLTKTTGSEVTFTDNTAELGVKYRYTIRGYRMEGTTEVLSSSREKGITAKVPFDPVVGVSIAPSGSNRNTISWKAVTGATGYQISCKEGEAGKFARVAGVRRSFSYEHKGLQSGTTYYYRIRPFRKVTLGGKTKYVYGAWTEIQGVTAK